MTTTPKRQKVSKKNRRTHIPPLSPERHELMRNMMMQAPQIPEAARRQINDILRAASNPEGESVEAGIRGLETERKRIVRENQAELNTRFNGVVSRGSQELLMMDEAEWQRLIEESLDE